MHSFPGKYLANLCLSLGLLAACQAGTVTMAPFSFKINPQVTVAAQALKHGETTSARTDAQGRLQVYVYVTELTSDTVSRVERAGLMGIEDSPEMNLVQGWVAPSDLDALAALSCVKTITLPRYTTSR